MANDKPIILATRGSALALAQANMVLAQCRAAFPALAFDIRIYKTTGDKIQTASLASANLPKGLFTKELEVALLNGEADLAVHSLKDLPTELPDGLVLGAVLPRADVRDVLIYRAATAGSPQTPAARAGGRGFGPRLKVTDLPQGATIATSSNRRAAQLQEHRPDLKIVPIRGNVHTRLRKLAEQPEIDASILAAAGMDRLGFSIDTHGQLGGPDVPPGLLARRLEPDEMLPCVGQAAIGLETRANDPRTSPLCQGLNHLPTYQSVTAERAFLRAMGGGCQVPLGAYAQIINGKLHMRVVSYMDMGLGVRRAEASRLPNEAAALGAQLAQEVK